MEKMLKASYSSSLLPSPPDYGNLAGEKSSWWLGLHWLPVGLLRSVLASWFVRAPISAIALQLNDLACSWVQPNCIMLRSSVALDRLSVPVAAVISLPAAPLLSLLTTGSGEDVTDPTAPTNIIF